MCVALYSVIFLDVLIFASKVTFSVSGVFPGGRGSLLLLVTIGDARLAVARERYGDSFSAYEDELSSTSLCVMTYSVTRERSDAIIQSSLCNKYHMHRDTVGELELISNRFE